MNRQGIDRNRRLSARSSVVGKRVWVDRSKLSVSQAVAYDNNSPTFPLDHDINHDADIAVQVERDIQACNPVYTQGIIVDDDVPLIQELSMSLAKHRRTDKAKRRKLRILVPSGSIEGSPGSGSNKLSIATLDSADVFSADSVFGHKDNTQLLFLNPPNLLENVRRRFKDLSDGFAEEGKLSDCGYCCATSHGKMHHIYTMTGWLLLAVNPYRELDMYNTDWIERFMGKSIASNEPHPFAIAENAYNRLIAENISQSVIISGESGSGKTESCKHVIKYLAAVSDKRRHSISDQVGEGSEERVLQTNPLLEAFGNAKTVRNDNSSRFGKLVQLNFTADGRLKSASIKTYLLAKSRVVNVPAGERNYHIFYSLLDSLSNSEYEGLFNGPGPEEDNRVMDGGLENIQLHGNVQDSVIHHPDINQRNADQNTVPTAKYFRYLLTSDDSLESCNHHFSIGEIRRCFDAVNVGKRGQDDIFRILLAILFLGNLQFEEMPNDGSRVVNPTTSRCIARLLGIELKDGDDDPVNTALTSRRVRDTRSNLNKQRAAHARDALAKCLYALLFEHIRDHINLSLDIDHFIGRPAGSDQLVEQEIYIGILDIFGFEDLNPTSNNSFEQLCINFANEKLHAFQLDQLINREKLVYRQEGIAWEGVDYKDNSDICRFIAGTKSELGVFQVLDEMSSIPFSGNKDHRFSDKVHNTIRSTIQVLRPQRSHCHLSFTLVHYAGDVTYKSEDFVEKNTDSISDEIFSLLGTCGDFVSNTLRSNAKKIKPKSLGTTFTVQVDRLMEDLSTTSSHFIRCIKPNDDQKPDVFDIRRVYDQLTTSGMVEILEVMKEGFPCRVPYSHLWARYSHMLPESMKTMMSKDFAELTLLFLKTSPDDYRLGTSKAFFRFGALEAMDKIQSAADVEWQREFVQQMQHYWLQKRKKRVLLGARIVARLALSFKKQRARAVSHACKEHFLATFLPRWRERKAVKIQNKFRARRCQKSFDTVRRRIVMLQALVRGWRERKRQRQRQRAATKIQAFVRMCQALVLLGVLSVERKQYVQSICRIQRAARLYIDRKAHHRLQRIQTQGAAVIIRAYRLWRCQQVEIIAVVMIQSAFRSFKAQAAVVQKLEAITHMQRLCRGWKSRKQCMQKLRDIIKIQTAYRRHQAQIIAERKMQWVVKLQSLRRSLLARRKVSHLRVEQERLFQEAQIQERLRRESQARCRARRVKLEELRRQSMARKIQRAHREFSIRFCNAWTTGSCIMIQRAFRNPVIRQRLQVRLVTRHRAAARIQRAFLSSRVQDLQSFHQCRSTVSRSARQPTSSIVAGPASRRSVSELAPLPKPKPTRRATVCLTSSTMFPPAPRVHSTPSSEITPIDKRCHSEVSTAVTGRFTTPDINTSVPILPPPDTTSAGQEAMFVARQAVPPGIIEHRCSQMHPKEYLDAETPDSHQIDKHRHSSLAGISGSTSVFCERARHDAVLLEAQRSPLKRGDQQQARKRSVSQVSLIVEEYRRADEVECIQHSDSRTDMVHLKRRKADSITTTDCRHDVEPVHGNKLQVTTDALTASRTPSPSVPDAGALLQGTIPTEASNDVDDHLDCKDGKSNGIHQESIELGSGTEDPIMQRPSSPLLDISRVSRLSSELSKDCRFGKRQTPLLGTASMVTYTQSCTNYSVYQEGSDRIATRATLTAPPPIPGLLLPGNSKRFIDVDKRNAEGGLMGIESATLPENDASAPGDSTLQSGDSLDLSHQKLSCVNSDNSVGGKPTPGASIEDSEAPPTSDSPLSTYHIALSRGSIDDRCVHTNRCETRIDGDVDSIMCSKPQHQEHEQEEPEVDDEPLVDVCANSAYAFSSRHTQDWLQATYEGPLATGDKDHKDSVTVHAQAQNEESACYDTGNVPEVCPNTVPIFSEAQVPECAQAGRAQAIRNSYTTALSNSFGSCSTSALHESGIPKPRQRSHLDLKASGQSRIPKPNMSSRIPRPNQARSCTAAGIRKGPGCQEPHRGTEHHRELQESGASALATGSFRNRYAPSYTPSSAAAFRPGHLSSETSNIPHSSSYRVYTNVKPNNLHHAASTSLGQSKLHTEPRIRYDKTGLHHR
eukprot:GHVQ01014142.1.p1 GENE.GHVQ01014142.1~~GHVQ01014142.1.p1  ORF type:complete len:2082 (+),score=147.98 GHVQ01014142.1:382-6627(+)